MYKFPNLLFLLYFEKLLYPLKNFQWFQSKYKLENVTVTLEKVLSHGNEKKNKINFCFYAEYFHLQ